eukprot:Gregarina_sp_Poly_1__4903@NODE_25_length_19863_cov_179_262730_g23_i0_p9_GENE_NODE_25_length_19863_cov_179_262730_g23_i0NODE_25_length_19863_cov_179_262730_g23_i0_p9_ORF_typecomplete_len215_score31_56_NODE_25_length_19863_cov_179_262730_g23_i01204612690
MGLLGTLLGRGGATSIISSVVVNSSSSSSVDTSASVSGGEVVVVVLLACFGLFFRSEVFRVISVVLGSSVVFSVVSDCGSSSSPCGLDSPPNADAPMGVVTKSATGGVVGKGNVEVGGEVIGSVGRETCGVETDGVASVGRSSEGVEICGREGSSDGELICTGDVGALRSAADSREGLRVLADGVVVGRQQRSLFVIVVVAGTVTCDVPGAVYK